MDDLRKRDGRDEQWCDYCGSELESLEEPLDIDERSVYKVLKCPLYSGWWWHRDGRKHRYITIGIELSDTVLNYDPFTGERLNHAKSK